MKFVLKVDMNRLSEAFKRAPIEVGRELRIEMNKAMRTVQIDAREHHRFHSKSGQAVRSIQTTVDKNGLEGKVGINPDIAKYAIYQHEGTKPHWIRPVNKKSLYWVTGGNKFFSKKVKNPGIKKDQFLYKAFDRQKTYIVARMKEAIDRAFKIAGVE